MRPVTDLQRKVAPFEVVTDMVPAGDQPAAIAEIERRIRGGESDTVLLGATGTGKTASVAWLAERLDRPVLVMLPNKTLAAQFANELREMMPRNAVEYFVSYYDYYQPEAYVPSVGHLHREGLVNQRRDRPAAPLGLQRRSLLLRPDTIVVASVSCIYGLGSPARVPSTGCVRPCGLGEVHDAAGRCSCRKLVEHAVLPQRRHPSPEASFRARGDTVEIHRRSTRSSGRAGGVLRRRPWSGCPTLRS